MQIFRQNHKNLLRICCCSKFRKAAYNEIGIKLLKSEFVFVLNFSGKTPELNDTLNV